MKRTIIAALALIFALGLLPQAARAQDNNWNALWAWITRGQDPRLFWGGATVGAGTGVAGYYATKKHGTPPHRFMSYRHGLCGDDLRLRCRLSVRRYGHAQPAAYAARNV